MFSEWEKVFDNPMATAAAIDRIVHHSVILEFDVPSYRTDAAQNRRTENEKLDRQKWLTWITSVPQLMTTSSTYPLTSTSLCPSRSAHTCLTGLFPLGTILSATTESPIPQVQPA